MSMHSTSSHAARPWHKIWQGEPGLERGLGKQDTPFGCCAHLADRSETCHSCRNATQGLEGRQVVLTAFIATCWYGGFLASVQTAQVPSSADSLREPSDTAGVDYGTALVREIGFQLTHRSSTVGQGHIVPTLQDQISLNREAHQ